MHQLRRLITPLLSLGVIGMAVQPLPAQLFQVNWIVMTGSYNDDASWDSQFGPPVAEFDEVGNINNGGTAVVDSNPEMPPGGIVLGAGGAQSGTLEIQSGASFVVAVDGANPTPGSVVVGQSGTGHLIVAGGGAFTSESLSSGGNAASSMVMGEGTGTTTVTVNGSANLNRVTRVVGPNVNFSAGSLSLGGTLTSVITGANHSTLDVSGTADIGGALDLQFQGVTPNFNDTWDLVDASTISGGFDSITADFDPGLGRRFATAVVAGGTNGSLLRLQQEQILALTVNRASGSVELMNLPGGEPVELDGYQIVSPSGALNPAGWTSFQSQQVSSFEESNPQAGHLAELDPLASTTVGGGTTIPLGNVFQPNPTEFGVDIEDLQFDYTRPDGTVVTGDVAYTGLGINNLVLRVNPANGQGTLVNESGFTVDIDGYAILSPSGALRPDAGNYNSLADQGVSVWEEANISASQLSELNPTEITTFSPLTNFDLGTLFNTAGERDLSLLFSFPSEDAPREGVVVYEAFVPPDDGISGDYNGDGMVNAADYVVFRNNLEGDAAAFASGSRNPALSGPIGPEDYDFWAQNFGAGGGGTAVGVPEPISGLLSLLAAVVLGCYGRTSRPATF